MRTKFPTRGFTLVELMIAMTITLLLMAALGKSFAVIGKSMKEGRSKVALSSQLRSISFRLRSDLRSRTVSAMPPAKTVSGQGYFMYYEGPLTEHTYGLYGAAPERRLEDGTVVHEYDPRDTTNPASTNAAYAGADNPTFRKYAQMGDIDDYIAFTATAPGDDWFTGKVPAYLVDDTATDPMQPRIIRSKHAEIIMWASPVWDIDEATNSLRVLSHPAGMPVALDEAGGPKPLDLDGDSIPDASDLVPDRVVLHQRILLIRPDLNVNRTIPGASAIAAFNSPVLRPLGNSTNPASVPTAMEAIYPIGIDNNGTTSLFGSYVQGASATDNTQMLTSNWLVGMAPLHQFYDLSLRRVVHPVTGEPTGFAAANSLEDLVQPHNRFAHVRYPGRYFNQSNTTPFGSRIDRVTSMPLLALGWNDHVLHWLGTTDPRAETPTAGAPAWFPNATSPNPLSPRTRNAAGTAATGDDSFFGLFNGWLLPHFELGDSSPAVAGDVGHWKRGYLTTPDSRWDRTGEDIVSSNILAFDVRGYDPTAPVFALAGPDGEPGKANFDDDGSGTNDDIYAVGSQYSVELGAVDSDDVIIGVGDLAIRPLVTQNVFDPANPPGTAPAPTSPLRLASVAGRGDFVDIFYPYLGGGPLVDRMGQTSFSTVPPYTGTASTLVSSNFAGWFNSTLSGLGIPYTGLSAIKRSGKLLHFNGTGALVHFQPTYDTWTDGYELDGFDQTHTGSGAVNGTPELGTMWVLNNVVTSVSGREARLPVPASPPALFSIDTGRYSDSQPETSAPLTVDMPAIQVSVRIIDPATNEMSQFSVVENLQ